MSKPRRTRLFVKPYCGWCHEAAEWLEERQIPFESIDVIGDPSAMREMVQISGQSLAPVIDVDGEILADFDVGQLEKFWRRIERE